MGRISIHTPLAGSDYSYTAVSIAGLRFQSTLPLRGATETQQAGQFDALISIHTPLAGSDCHGLAGAFSSPISIHTPLAGSDLSSIYGGRIRNQVSSIDARPSWYHGEGAPHAVEERHRIFVDAYGRSPQGAWIEIYWSLSARSRNARVSGRIQDRTHGLLTRRCHQRSHRPASTPDETNTGPYHAERSNPLRRSFPTRPSIPPPPTSTVRDAAAIH